MTHHVHPMLLIRVLLQGKPELAEALVAASLRPELPMSWMGLHLWISILEQQCHGLLRRRLGVEPNFELARQWLLAMASQRGRTAPT